MLKTNSSFLSNIYICQARSIIEAIPPDTASIAKSPDLVIRITSGIRIESFSNPSFGGNTILRISSKPSNIFYRFPHF